MKNAKYFINSGWIKLLIGTLIIVLSSILSYFNSESDYVVLCSIGSGIFATGAVYIIKYKKILKNPKKSEEFELAQNDERNIFVFRRSAELGISIIMILNLVLLIVCSCITSLKAFTMPLSMLICVHVLVLFCTYKFVNKKY